MYWDKEVEIIYQNMDGQPCKCNAIYHFNNFGNSYFEATNGMAKGNRMCGVIAYRPLEQLQEIIDKVTFDECVCFAMGVPIGCKHEEMIVKAIIQRLCELKQLKEQNNE